MSSGSGYSSEEVKDKDQGKQKKKKQGSQKKEEPLDWCFDCKDSSHDSLSLKQEKQNQNKFGNFNTPIVMKLCSKYNKKI